MSSKIKSLIRNMMVTAAVLAITATPVFAKTSSIVIIDKDNNTYEYSYAALKQSAQDSLFEDPVGAALYNHFLNNKSSVKAYFDDERNVYIPSEVIFQAAQDKKMNDEKFNLDEFTKDPSNPTIDLTTQKVQHDSNGNILIDGTIVDNPDKSQPFNVDIIY